MTYELLHGRTDDHPTIYSETRRASRGDSHAHPHNIYFTGSWDPILNDVISIQGNKNLYLFALKLELGFYRPERDSSCSCSITNSSPFGRTVQCALDATNPAFQLALE